MSTGASPGPLGLGLGPMPLGPRKRAGEREQLSPGPWAWETDREKRALGRAQDLGLGPGITMATQGAPREAILDFFENLAWDPHPARARSLSGSAGPGSSEPSWLCPGLACPGLARPGRFWGLSRVQSGLAGAWLGLAGPPAEPVGPGQSVDWGMAHGRSIGRLVSRGVVSGGRPG